MCSVVTEFDISIKRSGLIKTCVNYNYTNVGYADICYIASSELSVNSIFYCSRSSALRHSLSFGRPEENQELLTLFHADDIN